MNEIRRIEKLDDLGRGITYKDNKIMFVNNALVGDLVKVKNIKEHKNYFESDVDTYIERGNNIKKNYCKYYSECGGCSIGELEYSKQLEYKEDKVKRVINKYLKEDIKVNNIIYSNDLGYRNKVTLHVKDKIVGFYKNKTNSIIKIDNCCLLSDRINNFIKKTKNIDLSKINEIIIRESNTNQIMIIFKGIIDKDILLDEFKEIDCIYINDDLIKGNYIINKIGDYSFIVMKDSFFQVNSFNTINLYNKVLDSLKGKNIDKVLDLYCGTGTIGIYVSKYVKEVIGIEQNKDAVISANKNKELNNVKNIRFINSKVEDYIDKLNNIDCIITDPPRSGMDKKTIEKIKRINPRMILYVSCDIMTLVRDLNLLKDKYNIKEITPVDMFPNTYHCESVSILERR